MGRIAPAFAVLLFLIWALAAPRAAAQAQDLSRALERAAAVVSPAVVEIFTTSFRPGEGAVSSAADLIATERGSGSGVIVDPQGFIVTNAHVVRGAQRVTVQLPSPSGGKSILAAAGRIVAATVVGLDLETDLAVLKVDAGPLTPLAFGDSDTLKPGQLVLAFGSPLRLQNSVSMGIVSAVARQLEPDSPMIYVQTDASINPGSSGGPLVDVDGRMVGLNTLIFSRAGGSDGLGFAAPSNIVRTVFEQIKAHGRVRRGDIGVRAQTLTPEIARGLSLDRQSGVIVADVMPASPAARAGVERGDIVLAVDDKPMENSRQLQVTLYRRFAGDRVMLEVLRDGKPLRLPVAIVERPGPFEGLVSSVDARQHLIARLGVLGVDLDPRLAAAIPVLRVSTGVVVVRSAGVAGVGSAGLQTGDVIFGVNRTGTGNLAALRAALDTFKAGETVVLHVERRGERLYLTVTIE